MRYKFLYMICLLLIISVISFGCSIQSEEDALQHAEKSAENVFYSKDDIEPNEQTTEFDFYLPKGLEIEEKSKSNLILSNGNEHYIVFNNNLESPQSKLNYKSAEDSKALVYKSFKDEDKFGYLQITEGTDDNYQIQAGIGGVKITTYSSKTDLDTTAKQLMQIARSITQEEVTS